jgi:hypothetical protein
MKLRNVPTRLAAGAFILHTGLGKWRSGPEQAAGVHGMLTMYARTPALRERRSIWPSQQGIAVAKDVWMLGIGLGLLLDPSDSGSSSRPMSARTR